MIPVPQDSIEKPLTAIDYIAALDAARTVDDVQQFSEQLPAHILHDERYTRAVRRKLDEIHGKGTERRVA